MIPLLSILILLLASTMSLFSSTISLGLFILLMMLMSSMMISMFVSPTIALMLFMIYVSGLMIIFSYFLSITPNEKYKWSSINKISSLISLMTLTPLFITIITPNQMETNIDTNEQFMFLYKQSEFTLPTFLATLLFIILIYSVKISAPSKGSLRPFK